LSQLVGGLDHVAHEVVSLSGHLDQSWSCLSSFSWGWSGGGLLLLESLKALDGSSAAFDGLHDSGSVGDVSGVVGGPGGDDLADGGAGLVNSARVTIENILFTMSCVAPLSDFSVAHGHDSRLLINNSLLVLKHEGVLPLAFVGADHVGLLLLVKELSQLVESGEEPGVVGFAGLHLDPDEGGDRSSEWGSFDLLKDVVDVGLLTEREEVGVLVLDSVSASYQKSNE